MTVEIISRSISTNVWDRTGIELATPGSAVRHASVARHVTHCATRPGYLTLWAFNLAFSIVTSSRSSAAPTPNEVYIIQVSSSTSCAYLNDIFEFIIKNINRNIGFFYFRVNQVYINYPCYRVILLWKMSAAKRLAVVS